MKLLWTVCTLLAFTAAGSRGTSSPTINFQRYVKGCQPGEYLTQPSVTSGLSHQSYPYLAAEAACKRIGGLIPEAVAFGCLANYVKDALVSSPNFANTMNVGPYAYLPHYANFKQPIQRWLGSDGNTRGQTPNMATGLAVCLVYDKFQYGCPPGEYLTIPKGKTIESTVTMGPTASQTVEQACLQAGLRMPTLKSHGRCAELFILRSLGSYPQLCQRPDYAAHFNVYVSGVYLKNLPNAKGKPVVRMYCNLRREFAPSETGNALYLCAGSLTR